MKIILLDLQFHKKKLPGEVLLHRLLIHDMRKNIYKTVISKNAMGQFYNGIQEQIQHFAELSQKNMFIYIHNRLSVSERFAKFGCQWRT